MLIFSWRVLLPGESEQRQADTESSDRRTDIIKTK